jgi:hypothetical protein
MRGQMRQKKKYSIEKGTRETREQIKKIYILFNFHFLFYNIELRQMSDYRKLKSLPKQIGWSEMVDELP